MLVTAGQVADDLIGGRSFDIQLFNVLLRRLICLGLIVKAVGQQLFDRHHSDVVIDRSAQVQARDLPILRDQGHALLNDILGRGDIHLLALHIDLAAGEGMHTEDALHQLAASGAHQTADA